MSPDAQSTATSTAKANSTRLRNTLTNEVIKDGDEGLEQEDPRGARRVSLAVAC